MFDLHVSDCWRALARAKAEGLMDFGVDGFDLEEYEDIRIASRQDTKCKSGSIIGVESKYFDFYLFLYSFTFVEQITYHEIVSMTFE